MPVPRVTIPKEFETLIAFCLRNNFSLEACVQSEPEIRPQEERLESEDWSLETIFNERLPLIVEDLATFQYRSDSLGATVSRIYTESLARNLSTETLRTLSDLGYDIEWLCYGCRSMLKEGYSPIHRLMGDFTSPLSGAQVRTMRSMVPAWGGLDWGWLHSNRFLRKHETAPSMDIMAKAVVCWNIPPFMPSLPNPVAVCTKIQNVARTIDRRIWKRNDWHHYIVRRLQTTPARVGMLLGLTPVSANAYIAGTSNPTDCARKAFFIFDYIVTRYGRAGLINLIDIVNEEAQSRGFENLADVFRQRTWGWSLQAKRKAAQDAIDNGVRFPTDQELDKATNVETETYGSLILERSTGQARTEELYYQEFSGEDEDDDADALDAIKFGEKKLQ